MSGKRIGIGIPIPGGLEDLKGMLGLSSPDENLEKGRSLLKEFEEAIQKQEEKLKILIPKREELQRAMAHYHEHPSEEAKNRLLLATADLTLAIANHDIGNYEKSLQNWKENLAENKKGLAELEKMVEQHKKKEEAEEAERQKKGKEAEELLQKAKFQHGDSVRVSLNPSNPNENPLFLDSMEEFKGQVVTIDKLGVAGGEIAYLILEDDCEHVWAERWLELVPEGKKRLDH